MKFLRYAVILGLPILMVGCTVQHLEKKAYNKMEEQFNQLVGCTEEEVVLRIGAPNKITKTGELKVYQYHKDLGTETTYWFGSFSGSGNTRSKYDQTDVFFKDGRAISWKGSVRR